MIMFQKYDKKRWYVNPSEIQFDHANLSSRDTTTTSENLSANNVHHDSSSNAKFNAFSSPQNNLENNFNNGHVQTATKSISRPMPGSSMSPNNTNATVNNFCSFLIIQYICTFFVNTRFFAICFNRSTYSTVFSYKSNVYIDKFVVNLHSMYQLLGRKR